MMLRWRQQSRAGSGHLVYSVCETALTRIDRDLRTPQSTIQTGLTTDHVQNKTQAINKSVVNKPHSARAVGHPAEYWLFSLVFNSDQILSVHVDIRYQMHSCEQDRGALDQGIWETHQCREEFDVMVKQFDQPDNNSQLQGFRQIDQLSPKHVQPVNSYAGNNLMKMVHANFRPTSKRFQLALRDTGACVLIDQLVIYYLHCPQTEVNLMQLPQTHAGHNAEIRFVPGTCVSGATHSVGPFPMAFTKGPTRVPGAFCMVNGKWHLDDDEFQCICEPGFELGPKGLTCEACLRGTFKPIAGNGQCRVCPLNSMATNLGQLQCDCLPGYFRLSRISSPNYPCFGPPSSPRNLNAVRINGTSVELTWDHPIRSGGLKDIQFHVTCQGCTPNAVTYSPSNLLNGTRVRISGLQPLTRYQFDVYAQNEASSLADALWAHVTSVIVTTRSAPTILVNQVRSEVIAPNAVLLQWKALQLTPTQSNHTSSIDNQVEGFAESLDHLKAVNYEVCVILANQSGIMSVSTSTPRHPIQKTNGTDQPESGLVTIPSAVYHTSVPKIKLDNLSREHAYWIQIRAQTDYAYGPYSSPLYLQLTPDTRVDSWTTPYPSSKLTEPITVSSLAEDRADVNSKEPIGWSSTDHDTEEKIVTTGLVLSVGLALFMSESCFDILHIFVDYWKSPLFLTCTEALVLQLASQM
ncbi:unnamed protein product [Echinostoma caproni]|uniref:Receptor protein-tyrosine kinase n=1 Tax=Echinostoma caproni TaxID=27848 RepID=A0A183A4X2_9TREM|nr:unnamed protein product [Echinostoma caproni]